MPAAIFSGPNQIKFTSFASPLLKLLMLVCLPFSYPIAKLLDCLVNSHDEQDGYNRGELSALVRIQYEEHKAAQQRKDIELAEIAAQTSSYELLADSTGGRGRSKSSTMMEAATFESGAASEKQQPQRNAPSVPHRRGHTRDTSMHGDEVAMVEGALQMKLTHAIDIYTKMRNVFAIPLDFVLDEAGVVKIYAQGYSRIPVYVPNKSNPSDCSAICGVLMTKKLIVVDTVDHRPVSTMPLQRPACVSPDTNLVDTINILQGTAEKGGHMALVCTRPDMAAEALAAGQSVPEEAGLMGIITLEDVLEVLLQEKVYDEMNHTKRKAARLAKVATNQWRAFVQKQKETRKETATQQDGIQDHPSRTRRRNADGTDQEAGCQYMLCLD